MAGYDVSFMDAGFVFSLFTRTGTMGELYLHLPVLPKNCLPKVLAQMGGGLWSPVGKQSALKTLHGHAFGPTTVLQVSNCLEAIFR